MPDSGRAPDRVHLTFPLLPYVGGPLLPGCPAVSASVLKLGPNLPACHSASAVLVHVSALRSVRAGELAEPPDFTGRLDPGFEGVSSLAYLTPRP
jgi:hypothetical protein